MAHRISGVHLTPISVQPRTLRIGSQKNTDSPASGLLPSSANSSAPHSVVSSTASRGDSQDISCDGAARGSSLGMLCLPRRAGMVDAAHPQADLLAAHAVRR